MRGDDPGDGRGGRPRRAAAPRGGARARTVPPCVAVACLLLAACPADRPAPPEEAGADVVATVNGHAITRDALAAFAAVAEPGIGPRPLGDAVERQLLLRMVDEELLLQRAVETGLYRSDLRSREALLSAVIAGLGSGQAEPDEAELTRYYEQNAAAFSPPGDPSAAPLPYEAVRDAVRRSYLRQRLEGDLRRLLEALRREADVRVYDRDLVGP